MRCHLREMEKEERGGWDGFLRFTFPPVEGEGETRRVEKRPLRGLKYRCENDLHEGGGGGEKMRCKTKTERKVISRLRLPGYKSPPPEEEYEGTSGNRNANAGEKSILNNRGLN